MLFPAFLALTALVLSDLHVEEPYTFRLRDQINCSPSTFEVQAGFLPSGVLLSSDGVISGTPQLGGTYEARIKTACYEFPVTMYVADPAPFRIRFGGFFAAIRGRPYVYDLRSSESGVLTWTFAGGHLPLGFVVQPNGFVSGIPHATGRFTFRVKVDDGRRTATRPLPERLASRVDRASPYV